MMWDGVLEVFNISGNIVFVLKLELFVFRFYVYDFSREIIDEVVLGEVFFSIEKRRLVFGGKIWKFFWLLLIINI